MIRACPRSLVVGILFALCAMSFMIASVSKCASGNGNMFAQGPFCSVEHTSRPVSTQKSAPDMALIQELAVVIAVSVILTIFSKRVLEKTLARWTSLEGRNGNIQHTRLRLPPIPLQSFLPQISSAHGM